MFVCCIQNFTDDGRLHLQQRDHNVNDCETTDELYERLQQRSREGMTGGTALKQHAVSLVSAFDFWVGPRWHVDMVTGGISNDPPFSEQTHWHRKQLKGPRVTWWLF